MTDIFMDVGWSQVPFVKQVKEGENGLEIKTAQEQEMCILQGSERGCSQSSGDQGMSKGDTLDWVVKFLVLVSGVSQKLLSPGGAQSWVWVGTAILENLKHCLKGVPSNAVWLFALIIMVRNASALI